MRAWVIAPAFEKFWSDSGLSNAQTSVKNARWMKWCAFDIQPRITRRADLRCRELAWLKRAVDRELSVAQFARRWQPGR